MNELILWKALGLPLSRVYTFINASVRCVAVYWSYNEDTIPKRAGFAMLLLSYKFFIL